MRLVIALAFGFGWLGRDDLSIHHGLDDCSLVLAKFGRCQRLLACRARQQTPTYRLLAQQLGVSQFAQGGRVGALPRRMQADAIDAGSRQGGAGDFFGVTGLER